MPTEIDSLELKISSNSKTAAKGIDALTASLTKLKNATSGDLGLSSLAKELGNVKDSTSKAASSAKKSSSSFTDFYHKIGAGKRCLES